MNCFNCGNLVNEGIQSCPYCGAVLSPQAVSEPPANMRQDPQEPMPPSGYAQAQPAQALPDQPEYAPPATPPQEAAFPAEYPPPGVPSVDPGLGHATTQPDRQPAEGVHQATQPVGPGAPKTKKKLRAIKVVVAAAVVAVLTLGGVVGFYAFAEYQRGATYAEAVELMDQGDYQAALGRFNELGEYEDAPTCAEYCTNAIAFFDAMALLDNGEYAAARDGFAALGTFMDAGDYVVTCEGWLAFREAQRLTDEGSYTEASGLAAQFNTAPDITSSAEYEAWLDKNRYGLADQQFAEGEFYAAYNAFRALGDYEDAAARAESCKQSMPENTELYHNEAFISSSVDIVFDGGASPWPNYIKVYSGDSLVSALFVGAGAKVTIQVPEGTYTFKPASGDTWFGEKDMFGEGGYYSVMLFEESGEEIAMTGNTIYTITLYTDGDGNVGEKTVGRDGF